jgi:hypothetical protein
MGVEGGVARGLPVIEVALGIALLTPTPLGEAAAILSLGLLIIFSLWLLRTSELRDGCGCWSAPNGPPTKGALLGRNVSLIAVAIAGTFPLTDLDWRAALFALPAGAIIGGVALEAPNIALVTGKGRLVG